MLAYGGRPGQATASLSDCLSSPGHLLRCTGRHLGLSASDHDDPWPTTQSGTNGHDHLIRSIGWTVQACLIRAATSGCSAPVAVFALLSAALAAVHTAVPASGAVPRPATLGYAHGECGICRFSTAARLSARSTPNVVTVGWTGGPSPPNCGSNRQTLNAQRTDHPLCGGAIARLQKRGANLLPVCAVHVAVASPCAGGTS